MCLHITFKTLKHFVSVAFISVFIICFPFSALAQSSSNLIKKTFPIVGDTLVLDSLSIIPNTLNLRDEMGSLIDESTYTFFPFSSKVIWLQKPQSFVTATYRHYPFALANRFYKKNIQDYINQNTVINIAGFEYRPTNKIDDFIDFGSIEYAGNFSRGLSFGSNQDVVLNSVLNLQLRGNLTKDLEVIANVTDNNIPIQPDGTTQQLQEFDKIFIQLRRKEQSIIVGDFDMIASPGYFMRYSKKAQGARIDGVADFKKAGVLRVNAGGGISRGKFVRNTLPIREGNQGPYKLFGANGESFIIVLANTEEVFVNGVKQVRGFDKDYIIDYNTGQITFTPRRILTRDLRVVVEFEYAERSYQRSMAQVNLDYEVKKTKIGFSIYSEQDSKNQNVQQNLTPEKKQLLASIGDSLDKAFFTGVDSVSFDASRILYRRVDTFFTFIPGVFPYTYYEYSTNAADAKFNLNFSFVGEGAGNYVIASNTANGRSYRFVPPVYDEVNSRFVLQGAYEPVIKLIAPAYEQLYTLRAEQGIGKYVKFGSEVSLSNRDINLFSKQNDNDNLGLGTFHTLTFQKYLKGDSIKKKSVYINAAYEFIDKRFLPIERYRNVEFTRDFNTIHGLGQSNEHNSSFSLGYDVQQLFSTSYRLRSFISQANYQGFEHGLALRYTPKHTDIRMNSTVLHAKSTKESTLFVRPSGEISYRIPKMKGWKIGLLFNHEILRTQLNNTDTLDKLRSHVWQEYRFFMQSPDTNLSQYRIEYFLRTEQKAKGLGYDLPDRIGHNVSITGNVANLKNQSLTWNLTYRNVSDRDRDSVRGKNELQNFYLGRIDYTFNFLKGLLRSTFFYQLGAGQQPKLQLVYVISPTNKGDYIWQGDINNNGQKDITEFVPLNFQTDSSYIRTFIFTPDLVPINEVELNEALNINPSGLVKKSSSKFVKALGLFSFFNSIQLSKKIFSDKRNDPAEYFLPVSLNVNDTNIVQQVISSKNSIFFNRFSSKINAQFDVNFFETKTLLTSGVESRKNNAQTLTVRWNFWKTILLQTIFTNALKANNSDFFKEQQYNIEALETRNEISYLYKSMIRVGLNYAYLNRKNTLSIFGGQKAEQHQIALDFRFNKSSWTTVNSRFTFTQVRYADNGKLNNQAEFVILEGLRNGQNYVWNVSLEQKLNSLLQLVIGYDGRKTGTDRVVHSGRAEIRALF
jgi:hypothetical protein